MAAGRMAWRKSQGSTGQMRGSSVWPDPRVCEEAGAEKAGKLSGLILGKISEAAEEGLVMGYG